MARLSSYPSILSLSAILSVSCALDGAEPEQEEVALQEQGLSASNSSERAQLAQRWAPIHYMDVDPTGSHALGGKADYITRYDFDGDLDARNNWENAGSAQASFAAHAYYSVVETSSHWFITYLFFHPRDWTDSFFDTEHENDAEGVLLSIERDGSTFGVLRAAVTVAHTDFYSFVPNGSSWSSGGESIDGTLQLASSPHDGFQHPVTAQEAKGHGLKARPYYDIRGGDGIVYYPATQAEAPSNYNDRDVKYKLLDRGRARRCELASDPARVVAEYFSIPGALARSYTFNPFR